MPVSTERFIECLAATGIVSGAEAESLVGSLSPDARAADADGFARELVRQGKLTRYQAAAIYQGKSDGLLLGNYLILDRLGAGGMGQVFRARHRRMDRVVALKMLSKRALDSPEAIARFLREVKTAARLVHPNIVTAYDADEVGGLHFLVMECVDGTDLSALVKNQGPLPVSQAINCLSQAAVGLEHAHRQGIVHRDIKPSNLLLDRSGAVKILDMGLARLGDSLEAAAAGPALNAELTSSGSIMGTIDYMAPEQALDCRHADARADFYSLGCTLHYLLTGRPPFSGETVVRRLTAHQQAPIPSLAAARPDVPSGVEAVFTRMLAKNPADRFQSMREVIEALKSSQAPAAPIIAQPVPRAVAATPPPPVAVAVPLSLPSVGLEGMESIVLPGSSRKRRRRKSPAPLVAAVGVLLLGAAGAGLWIMNDPSDARLALPATPKNAAPKAAGSLPEKVAASPAPTIINAAESAPISASPIAEPPPQQPSAPPAATHTEPTAVATHPSSAAVTNGPAAEPPKSAAAPPRDARHEVPPAAALQQARQLIEEVFKDDYAQAKAPEAKPQLAKKLLREAEKTQDDLAARYVLLREATDLAADAGDVALAVQALETLASRFVVDYMGEYSAVLLRMSAKPHSLAVETRLVEAALVLVDAAQAAGKFDAARTAADAAEDAARRTKDTALLKQMVDLKKTINAARQQWEAEQAALAVLDRSPDDPAANLLVGRYEAFVQGKWPQAFAHLAKGGSGLWPELAAKSLAPPTEPAALAELGDAWWKAGENSKNKERAELRAAAVYWYQQALPGLTGLKKDNVLNHLSDASDRTAVKGAILVFTFEPACFVTSGKSRYALDLSGQGNHAVANKVASVPGKVGLGLSFGVGNSYLECGKSDSLNDLAALSICAWIKPRSWKTSHIDYIVSKDDWADGGTHGFVFRGATDGDINFAFGNGDWRGTTSKRHLELDVWHHVASVYDGRRVTIFIDGVPDVAKDTPWTISPSSYPLRIGRGGFTPDRHFDGVIDELAVFNRPISDIEVRSLYRLGQQGKPLAK